MELPREILPANGLPKSRIGVDFYPPRRTIMGHPAGLPNMFGRVVLTDGFEYLVRTQDNRMIICHVQWFEERKDSSSRGRVCKTGDGSNSTPKARGKREAKTLEDAAAMVADFL